MEAKQGFIRAQSLNFQGDHATGEDSVDFRMVVESDALHCQVAKTKGLHTGSADYSTVFTVQRDVLASWSTGEEQGVFSTRAINLQGEIAEEPAFRMRVKADTFVLQRRSALDSQFHDLMTVISEEPLNSAGGGAGDVMNIVLPTNIDDTLDVYGKLTAHGDAQIDGNVSIKGDISVDGSYPGSDVLSFSSGAVFAKGDIMPASAGYGNVGSASIPFSHVYTTNLTISPNSLYIQGGDVAKKLHVQFDDEGKQTVTQIIKDNLGNVTSTKVREVVSKNENGIIDPSAIPFLGLKMRGSVDASQSSDLSSVSNPKSGDFVVVTASGVLTGDVAGGGSVKPGDLLIYSGSDAGNISFGHGSGKTLNLAELQLRADNAAALAAGLTPGTVYRTSDGTLKVVY